MSGTWRVVGGIAKHAVIHVERAAVDDSHDLAFAVDAAVPHRFGARGSRLHGPGRGAVVLDPLGHFLDPAHALQRRDRGQLRARGQLEFDARRAALPA